MIDWEKRYKNDINYWQFPENILDDLLGAIKKKDKILDLGCGCGYLVNQLQERGYCALGVDSSEEALIRSGDLYKKDLIKKGNLLDINFSEFDLVFIKFVLAFVSNRNYLLHRIKKSCSTLILIESVRLANKEYSKHAERISIEEGFLLNLLMKNFDLINLFFNEECELGLNRRIYILN